MSTPAAKKLLSHPDREKILNELKGDKSLRAISKRLKEKYPDNPELVISISTLHAYRKEFCEVDVNVIKDIRKAKKEKQKLKKEAREKKVITGALEYQEKINEIVDAELDVAKKIMRLDAIIESRMEYWYNQISVSEGKAIPTADKELRAYMDRQMGLLAQYKKFVEGMADKTVDHNININIINDQVSIIQGVIQDCLRALSPEQACLFMDSVNARLNQAGYRPQLSESVSLKVLDQIENQLGDGSSADAN